MKKVDLLYISPGSSFVNPLFSEDGKKVLEARIAITKEMIESFQEKYGKYLYYDSSNEKVKIPHYRVNIVYNNAKTILHEFEKTNKLSKTGYRAAEQVVDEVLSELNSIEIEEIDLLKELSSFDDYLYNHSVNVGFMTAVLAKRMKKFNEDELRSITLSAYLHDIGHKQIDKQLLNKEGAFNVSEFQKVKRHPQLGYEMIKNVNNTDPIIQQGVLFHHEKFNNNGYYQLPYENLPVFPKLISICDIYDALTTVRPFRKESFTSIQAVHAIINSIDTIFDYKLVSDFINIMPSLLNCTEDIFKKNDICALNSEELALIDSYNPDRILQPEVRVFCKFKRVQGKIAASYYSEAKPVKLSDDGIHIVKVINNANQLDTIRLALKEKKLI